MKKLYFKIAIIALPFLCLIGFFFADDPFGFMFNANPIVQVSYDVKHIKEFYKTKDQEKYTAFIFGNSRTLAFQEKAVQKHIGNEPFFNFGGPGECMLNIYKKIKLVHENKLDLKHAIVLIDARMLENTDNKSKIYDGPVNMHTPQTSDVSSVSFLGSYIKYYFRDLFFAKYITYKVTHTYTPWMADAFIDPAYWKEITRPVYSHKYLNLKDSLIETDFTAYKKVFRPGYSRDNVKNIPAISETDISYLKKIHELFDAYGTSYRIVIPPDFHQQKINPVVLQQLNAIFKDHVTDFTGVNKITSDSTMNYEGMHFSSRAATLILDSIYKKPHA